ncbi:hypothetical protein PENSPDRAFT_720695 [Peniophora sp. CONT]|nr:hypothetical protein PENSPDRAFT_720695 [Peniophora sp. CONT]
MASNSAKSIPMPSSSTLPRDTEAHKLSKEEEAQVRKELRLAQLADCTSLRNETYEAAKKLATKYKVLSRESYSKVADILVEVFQMRKENVARQVNAYNEYVAEAVQQYNDALAPGMERVNATTIKKKAAWKAINDRWNDELKLDDEVVAAYRKAGEDKRKAKAQPAERSTPTVVRADATRAIEEIENLLKGLHVRTQAEILLIVAPGNESLQFTPDVYSTPEMDLFIKGALNVLPIKLGDKFCNHQFAFKKEHNLTKNEKVVECRRCLTNGLHRVLRAHEAIAPGDIIEMQYTNYEELVQRFKIALVNWPLKGDLMVNPQNLAAEKRELLLKGLTENKIYWEKLTDAEAAERASDLEARQERGEAVRVGKRKKPSAKPSTSSKPSRSRKKARSRSPSTASSSPAATRVPTPALPPRAPSSPALPPRAPSTPPPSAISGLVPARTHASTPANNANNYANASNGIGAGSMPPYTPLSIQQPLPIYAQQPAPSTPYGVPSGQHMQLPSLLGSYAHQPMRAGSHLLREPSLPPSRQSYDGFAFPMPRDSNPRAASRLAPPPSSYPQQPARPPTAHTTSGSQGYDHQMAQPPLPPAFQAHPISPLGPPGFAQRPVSAASYEHGQQQGYKIMY